MSESRIRANSDDSVQIFKQPLFRQPWFVVTLLCFVYCLVFVAVKGDALELVTIGTQFSEGIAEEDGGTEGYDGQFNYFIARDPSTAAQFIDVPAYRFQRILLPGLGYLLSFGQEGLIPWVFLLINLAALAGGTAGLEYLLAQHGFSRWYVLGYSLSLGVAGSLRLSLAEPLAYGLVIGGIILAQRERWLWASVLFALAGLSKETALLFVGAYGLYLLVHRQWRAMFTVGLVSGVPFLVLQLMLYAQLGAFGVGSGGAMATGFEFIPFGGVLRIWTDGSPVVFLIFLAILGPFVLFPTLWALWRCWKELREGNTSVYVFLLLVNAGIMLFVPFSTYREPIGILRFIVGLQIAIILYAADRKMTRALRNSTLWVWTIAFIVSADFAPSSDGVELAE